MVLCVYPADHYIKDEKEFKSILEKAIYIAENNDKLVTIGITPTFPSTGYGYINFVQRKYDEDVAYEVVEFVENQTMKLLKNM